jgi:hypothetical protein
VTCRSHVLIISLDLDLCLGPPLICLPRIEGLIKNRRLTLKADDQKLTGVP